MSSPETSSRPTAETSAPATDGTMRLTAAQRGIFYAQELDPDVPMSVAAFFEFHDTVDADLLERATVAACMETQSGFARLQPAGDDEPRLVVDTSLDLTLRHVDLSQSNDPRQAAMSWIDNHRSTPVDVLADRLVTTHLLHLGEGHSIWYLWCHHLVLDGYGATIAMARVAAHYAAGVAGEQLPTFEPLSLAQLAGVDEHYRQSERFAADLAYWTERLAGSADEPEMMSFSATSEPAAPVAIVRSADLNSTLTQHIRDLAKKSGVRTATILATAVAIYLARFNDVDDATLSLPLAVRDTDELRGCAGVTSNVLPIRARLTGDDGTSPTVAQLLARVDTEIAGAVRHQWFRHEDISTEILPAAQGRRGFFGPMVNVMMFMSHLDFGPTRADVNVVTTGPVEDMSINLYRGFDGGMRLDLEANPNIYSANDIELHHRRIIDLLHQLVHVGPDAPVAAVTLPADPGTDGRGSAGEHVTVGEHTLIDLLDATADEHGELTALTDDLDTTLTHAGLRVRAERIARALAARGVGPEVVVAVMIPRSVDQVVALHAVTRSGAAYLPIDPGEPAPRRAHILATARPALVIAADTPHAGIDVPVVTLDDLAADTTGVAPARPRPDHPAYVLFTSGSTGLPKGVVISHRAIVNRLRWMQAEYALTEQDRVLQKTPATFDVSVWEFYWPFIVGAGLVVPTPDGHRDPWYLRETIARHGVTTVHFVPSMLSAFAAAHADGAGDDLRGLRRIITSGEALTPTTVAAMAAICPAPVHNLYGPTEAAIDVTHHNDCRADDSVIPIGRPVWNTTVRVLDRALRPQPAGAIGELYLGGVQLARGYVNRPALTASRFVADPFGGPGERLYRTGDLVRMRIDGALEYVGRDDAQVKIRGQRVELGEVESALTQLPGVRSAAAVIVGGTTADTAILAGYVCGADNLNSQVMRKELSAHLPAHMVPTAIVVLDDLPLTPSGKLDRRALPEPVLGEPDAEMVVPTDRLSRLVTRTIGDVLGIADAPEIGAPHHTGVSMTTGFFDLGGNSLAATRVAARLSAATGRRIGIRAIFDGDDAAGIVAALRESGVTDDDVADNMGSAAPTGPDDALTADALTDDTLTADQRAVPLSPAQHRLWLTARIDPRESAAYHIPFTVRFVGPLDVEALRAALNDVVARHEPLRTTVSEVDGIAYQRIVDVRPDLIELDTHSGDALSDRDFARLPIDLATDLPIRARLVTHADDDHSLTMVIHHIAADGWSLAPLAADLAAAYRARRENTAPAWTALPVSYSRAALAAHTWLDDPRSSAPAELDFWSRTLRDTPAETELPYTGQRPTSARPTSARPTSAGPTSGVLAGATAHSAIAPEVLVRLRDIAAAHDATMFMVLHAVVAVLLRTLSRTDDIVLGTAVSGRGAAELDSLVGMFVNTLALRTRTDKSLTFAEFLAQVKSADLDAFDNASYPFDRIVAELNPARGGTGQPFFSVAVGLDDDVAIDLDFPGLSVTASRVDTGIAKFDLHVSFVPHRVTTGSLPSRMDIEFSYATDLFDRTTIDALAIRLQRVLAAVTADPYIVIGDIEVLEPHERIALVPAPGRASRTPRHLSQLLADAVREAPGTTAVVDGDRSLTYTELDRLANRLARVLIRAGAGPEQYVAVSLPRSMASLVAIWAITRTGAAWVPVDPAYPARRRSFMLADSGARLVITDIDHAGDTDPESGPDSGHRTIVLGSPELAAELDAYSSAPIVDAERTAPIRVDHIAYLIYTSGTTGTPKGVAVTHRGLADLLASAVENYGVHSNSRTIQLVSPSFDASILELLSPLATSSTMYIVPPGIVGGRELSDFIARHRITHAFMTPSLLTAMSPADVPELRSLVIGGEAPNPDAVRQWSIDRMLFNGYGPTETTVMVTSSDPLTAADVFADGSVPLGSPLRGASLLVLDERLRPVAPGVVGELYIGGGRLARGYHGAAAITASRFVANPYGENGERLYRTGDLVRWRADSRLEFRGRIDQQTKIRGFRIQLGEIDAVLAGDPSVTRSATVVSGTGTQAALVSYVTGTGLDLRALRTVLSDHLPAHMVPPTIVRVDTIPLTPVGKTDLRALPDPRTLAAGDVDIVGTAEYVAPRGPIEARIAATVAEILELEPDSVGRDHDFFALGGNSLLATVMGGQLEALAGRRVPVRAIFEHPRIADLARFVAECTPDVRELPGLVHDPGAPAEPGTAQHRMWFANRINEAGAEYAIAFALDLRGPLDVDALRGALLAAVERHEPLRTRYPESDGRPVLDIRPAGEVTFSLEAVTADADEWLALARESARLPFDLTTELPLRVWLHRLAPDHHKLTVVIHHIAADGWSMAPLARDITRAYADLTGGNAPSLTPLPVTYRDYLRRQAALDLTASANWWARELAGIGTAPAVMASADYRDDDSRGARAGFIEVPFPASVREALRGRVDTRHPSGATEFMAVHALVALLLFRTHTDIDVRHHGGDIIIGTPSAGRDDHRLGDVVGMFVNLVALRTRIDPSETFADLLAKVRTADLDAFSHADIPIEEVLAAAPGSADGSTRPGGPRLLDVILSVENLPSTPSIDLAGLTVTPEELDTGDTRFALEVRVRGDVARFTYDATVFADQHVRGLALVLGRLAEQVVADPDRRLDDYHVPDDCVAAALVGVPARQPRHLALLLADVVTAHPDRPAVTDGVRALTYREFGALTRRWAVALADRGIGAEDAVVVAVSRSIESVAVVWAVTTAGAAFVPVDPRQPAERVAHLVADSRAVLGITAEDSVATLPQRIPWIRIADLDSGRHEVPATAPAVADPASVAYVIYTSGSTGRPKGVAVTHRGLIAFADSQTRRFGVEPGSRTLHFASPTFDASILELLLAANSGATLVIAPTDIYGGDELVDFLDDQRITHAFITPAALAAASYRPLPHLRTLGLGGESLRTEHIAPWIPGRHVINMYGPTETTVAATISEPLRATGPIPIGGPVDGTRLLVLDARLHPLPPYVPGELYVCGPGLARGYHGQPGRTAAAFVAHPDRPGERMYRTGDLVMTDHHGRLIYRGRTDKQVKVRGFRIELGEIDGALLAHPSVEFAVTVPHGDGASAGLASYVTVEPGADITGPGLRTVLAGRLPRHMVPDAVLVLDRIPLTTSGKVDRSSLPAPILAHDPGDAGRAPDTAEELAVAGVVADIIGHPAGSIAATDDFFELGGTSLTATTLISRINAVHTGDRIPVRAVFDQPTVEALARLVRLDGAAPVRQRDLGPRPETRIPQAPNQRRLWLISRTDPSAADYLLPLTITFRGDLDTLALRGALVDIVSRHAVLRTVYTETPDGAEGALMDAAEAVGDLPVRTNGGVDEYARELLSTGIDLASGPPLRAVLVAVDPGTHTLLLVIHHIAADGASLPILVGDLAAAYHERVAGRTAPWEPAYPDFRDYTLAMTSDEALESAAADTDYWTGLLADAPTDTAVPYSGPAPARESAPPGSSVSVELGTSLRDKLIDVARTHRTTPFTVLHTALAILLHRLGAGDDLVIGTPVSNRGVPGAGLDCSEVVGMFVNTLALRTLIDPAEAAATLIDRVRDDDLAAWDHLDAPFDDVVAVLNPTRRQGHHPLLGVILSVHGFADNLTPGAPDDSGLSLSCGEFDTGVAKFDAQFTITGVSAGAERPTLTLTYATDLYTDETARATTDRFVRVLHALTETPELPVGDIALSGPDELARLTPAAGPRAGRPATLAELFARAVASDPGGIAAISETDNGAAVSITYTELDTRSTRLARVLLERGVNGDPRRQSVVAMAVGRSVDALIAIWAITKTGAAYLPVDPGYPRDRITYMLTDSRAELVLAADRATAAAITADRPDTPALCLDDLAVLRQIAASSAEPLTGRERPAITVDHLAYIIYTSGSTGTPKGVLVPHRGLGAVSEQLATMMRPRTGSRVLAFASPGFDASVLELLLATASASTMVIAGPDILGGDDLTAFIARNSITHAFITPAAVAGMDPTAVPGLTQLAVGGEAVPADLVRRWAPGRVLHNVYGPTESTIIVTNSQVAQGDPVTIGQPNRGVAVAVLDTRLHPVPPGVVGELYVLGEQVTRGYQGRPGLTATRYLAVPATLERTGSQRMYRTGDLVRWTTAGALEYVGRSDDQVQIRGFRVELSEIDSAAGDCPGVRGCVTVVDDRRGSPVLRSYLIGNDDAAPDLADRTRESLGRRLPRHMVPTSITVLEEFPRTRNGKLDVAALPIPDGDGGRAPRTVTEALIAQAFSDVLGGAPVSADDDFFDLGGTSLTATTLVSRLRSLGVDTSVRQLFISPSPAELAALLPESPALPASPAPAIPAGPRPITGIPLAPMQRRLWLFARSAPRSADYLLPLIVELHGHLDIASLRNALIDVVARHTALRTTFADTPDGAMGTIVADPASVVGDLPVREDVDAADCAGRLCDTGIDITVEAPFRAALVRCEADHHALVLLVHHIAADGASLPIVVGDLLTAYTERAAGRRAVWEPAGPDYRDYAFAMAGAGRTGSGQADRASAALAYWTDALRGAPAETTLPPVGHPPTGRTSGATVSIELEESLRDSLIGFARARRSTPFSMLHTALAILLHRLGTGDDLVIGTPAAGRADYPGVVGMFVNTLALRTVLAHSDSAETLLAQVTADDAAAWDHLDAPFDDVVAAVNPDRVPGRHPLVGIVLSVHDYADTVDAHLDVLPGLRATVRESDTGAAKFDAQFTVTGMRESAAAPRISLTYDTGRYDDSHAAALLRRLVRVITTIVTTPGATIGDIAVTEPGEIRAIAPAAGSPAPEAVTVRQILAGAVMSAPATVAVVGDNCTGTACSMTYAELDARSNALARVLLGRLPSRWDGHQPVIAMALTRSVDALVAFWAIVKTGAVYLPIDPGYPAERIAHMLTDSDATLVVTTAADAALRDGRHAVLLDDPDTRSLLSLVSTAPIADSARRARLTPDHLAYLIYTSGSTGTPKGVLVPHRGIAALSTTLRSRMNTESTSRVLHFASPSFDAAILEMLLSTAAASTAVIVPPGIYGGADLTTFIDRHRITHAFITPAAVAGMDPAAAPSLTHLGVGGEATNPQVVRAWAAGRTMVNFYGPTEATVTTTSGVLLGDAPVTIGGPNAGVGAVVLDARLHPVPAGVTGELYLLGDQIARGYHGQTALTAARFVAAPAALGPGHAGRRIYRTGDLVRWTVTASGAAGALEYLGRADTQVQVRGFRIELSEIDAVLAAQPGVRSAVTVVDTRNGTAILRSYVIGDRSAAQPPDPTVLRSSVARRLPRHMVPATVAVLDELPLTPAGKLDQRALPIPRTAPGRAPAPGPESIIAAEFTRLLGLDVGGDPAEPGAAGADAVGADDGFFDLGGTSLLATTAATRLSAALGTEVTVQMLFAAPSPAELAVALATTGPTTVSPAFATVLPLRRPTADGHTPPPLFVIHPAMGLSWSYSALLPHIGAGRAVYGLQHPGLAGTDIATRSGTILIGDLAAHYVRLITEIAPTGPYHLLGWSIGGLVAHEIAATLQRDGRIVEQLTLLDTYVVSARPELQRQPSTRELLAELGGAAMPADGPEPGLPEIARVVRSAGGPLAALSDADVAALHAVYQQAGPAAAVWHPGVFTGATVFVTAAVSAAIDPTGNNRTAGPPAVADWSGHLAGPVRVIEAPCRHADLLSPECVGRYAGRLGY